MQNAENKVRSIYINFLESIKHDYYDEDELFDLATDLAEAIASIEYPHLSFKDQIGEELFSAVESFISAVSDRIKRKQKPERTEKMVRATLKRGRAIFDRIKPKEPKKFVN